jgi:Na+-transporting methylmalonyl-CoA/oxaloacetate decarboxylase gamma subunit
MSLIMNVLSTSLWITALGMGLVFGAILVLWLMMVLLTSLTADKEPASILDIEPAPVIEADFKAQAAAIAVAMALAKQQASAARALPEPPTVIVSAWQLGMRSRLLAEKGQMRRR